MQDPYFDSVVSLLNFSGMSGTTITDAIAARNWTAVGTAAVTGGELVIDGTQDCFVEMDYDLEFKRLFNGNYSQNWTIECKLRVGDVSGGNAYWGWRDTTDAKGLVLRQQSGNPTFFRFSGGDSTAGYDADIDSLGTISVNDVIEIAVTRDGDDYYLHRDGVYQGTVNWSGTPALGSTHGFLLGQLSHDQSSSGEIDMLRFRMTSGVSRYGTSNYNPLSGSDYPTEGPDGVTLQVQTADGWERVRDIEFGGAGASGIVPDPVTELNYFLRDDGTWAVAGGDQNLDGGRADSVYTAAQVIDGGDSLG